MDKVTLTEATIKRFGEDEITLNIKPWQVKWLSEFKGKPLTIEVKEAKAKRSIRQNSLLWALISEIDKAENGRTSEDGEMAIYCNLIKMARIKTLNYVMSEEIYQHTVKQGIFRHIEIMSHDEYYGTMEVRCYIGTSHFDVAEMTDFIAAALDYASNAGINLERYEELR